MFANTMGLLTTLRHSWRLYSFSSCILRQFGTHKSFTGVPMPPGGGLDKSQGSYKEEYFFNQHYRNMIRKMKAQGRTQFECEVEFGKEAPECALQGNLPHICRDSTMCCKHKNAQEEAYFMEQQAQCMRKFQNQRIDEQGFIKVVPTVQPKLNMPSEVTEAAKVVTLGAVASELLQATSLAQQQVAATVENQIADTKQDTVDTLEMANAEHLEADKVDSGDNNPASSTDSAKFIALNQDADAATNEMQEEQAEQYEQQQAELNLEDVNTETDKLEEGIENNEDNSKPDKV